MAKAYYSEFKRVVDDINAFRTGTLGMTNLSLTANPAAAQYARMTAAQVNELQNQSAALANYITTSVSRCSHLSGQHSSVKEHNYSYLNAHKRTLNNENYRDNSTYYSGYDNTVLSFQSYNRTVNANLSGPRYNTHYDTYYTADNTNKTHYANRASENTSKDTYNGYNSYLLTDDTSMRAYDTYYSANYSHRGYNGGYYYARNSNNRSYNVTN